MMRGLSERDHSVLALVLRGYSIREIARELGVGHATVERSLVRLRASGLFDMARREVFRQIVFKISAGVSEALDYLTAVVRGEKEGDALRVRAASVLLNMTDAFQSLALEELRREVEQLREAMEAGAGAIGAEGAVALGGSYEGGPGAGAGRSGDGRDIALLVEGDESPQAGAG